MPNLSVRYRSYILMIINAIFWGAAMIIVKPALEFTSPYRFLLYRYFLAGAIMLPYLIYYIKKNKPKTKDFVTITGIELLGTTLALGLLYTGLSMTSAIEASLIATTSPIFVVIAGVVFLKEKEEKHEIIGLAMAFLGTVFLVIIPLLENGSVLASTSTLGNTIILIQNILNAGYWILAKKHYKKMGKFFVATVSYLVGFTSFFLISIWSDGLSNLFTLIQSDFSHPSVVVASIYMAIFGSIIGYTAYIKGQDGIEASEASLFSYLQPLVYLPMGVLWLGEVISTGQIIAMVLILSGVVIVEKRTTNK